MGSTTTTAGDTAGDRLGPTASPPPIVPHVKEAGATEARRWLSTLARDSMPIDKHGIRRRPKMLDLFCGAGGAAAGYYLAGWDVTGVDIFPHNDYPFDFLQTSALDVGLSAYEAIHASPPCLAFTSIIPKTQREQHGHRWGHEPLIEPIRRRLLASNRPYIIENVMGAADELIDPVKLDGTMFDLRVFRPRLFESNARLKVTRSSDFAGKTLGIHSPKGNHGGMNAGNDTEMIREGCRPGIPTEGWRTEEVERQTGASKGRVDKYFYHVQTGKKFRSVVEVERFIGVRIPRPDPQEEEEVLAEEEEAMVEEEARETEETEEEEAAEPREEEFVSQEDIWSPHNREYFAVYGSPGARPGRNRGTIGQWQQAMAGPLLRSLSWMAAKPLAQSIPPAYTEYLGRQLLRSMGWSVDYPPLSYAGSVED